MTQAAFDDRYGHGAFSRVLQMLEQPCFTFAQIAGQFGVSRERVRQWHRRFLPDAPTGHERRRLCAVHNSRRRALGDTLFRDFIQRARAHFGPGRVEPIRCRGGYRTRIVMIDKQSVALRTLLETGPAGILPAFRYRGSANYLFLRFPGGDFAFVPARLAAGRAGRARVTDGTYRNSFRAFEGGNRQIQAENSVSDALGE